VSDSAAPPADVVTGKTVLGPLELLLSLFAALVLFALMVLRCIDVVGRYAFNAPVPGAAELTGLGLALLIFATLPIVTAYSEHVSVGLLELAGARFSRYTRRLERGVLLITSLAALALMAWRLWVKGSELASYGDGTSYLNIPVAPFAYFMSVMTALAVVVVALQIAAFFSRPPGDI
jgi:TRAP-type C4-dicarboxylate transport system permease small subunit